MTYGLQLSKEAEADLEGLYRADRRIFSRVLSKIETLSANPTEGKPLAAITRANIP